MGQDIGTILTGGGGVRFRLESTEFIQGSSPSLASVYPYTLPGIKVDSKSTIECMDARVQRYWKAELQVQVQSTMTTNTITNYSTCTVHG